MGACIAAHVWLLGCRQAMILAVGQPWKPCEPPKGLAGLPILALWLATIAVGNLWR